MHLMSFYLSTRNYFGRGSDFWNYEFIRILEINDNTDSFEIFFSFSLSIIL